MGWSFGPKNKPHSRHLIPFSPTDREQTLRPSCPRRVPSWQFSHGDVLTIGTSKPLRKLETAAFDAVEAVPRDTTSLGAFAKDGEIFLRYEQANVIWFINFIF